MDNTSNESGVSMYFSFMNDTENNENKTLESNGNENAENVSAPINIKEDAIQGRIKSPLRPINAYMSLSSTPTKNALPKPGDLRKSLLQDLSKAFDLPKVEKPVELPVYEDISVELIEVSDNDSTLQKVDTKEISEIIVILQEEIENVKEEEVKKVQEDEIKKIKEEETKQPVVDKAKDKKVSPEEHFESIAQGMCKKEVKFAEGNSNSDSSEEKMVKSSKSRKSIIPRIKSVIAERKPTPPMSLGNSSKVPRFAVFEKTTTTTSTRKPFHMMSRSTRMSILKTTLNSPARRDSLRNLDNSIIKISGNRLSVLPSSSSGRKSLSTKSWKSVASRKSVLPPTASALGVHSRKSVAPPTFTVRKSVAPPSFTSKKSVAPPTFPSSRKSVAPPTFTSRKSVAPLPTFTLRKSIAPPRIPANSTAKKSTPQQSKDDVSTKTFTCSVCSRKFLVESLFLAHKKSHDKATKQNIADNKTCKYCDKKFAIEKALENHLLDKCQKIPTAEKKKLLFPDLNKKKLPPPIIHSASSSMLSSDESLSSTVNKTVISANEKEMMPPSVTKVKKAKTHSGIYRTPSKRIECKLCKLSFGSCLEFTEHCLSHGGDHSKITLDSSRGERENTKNQK